MKIIMLILLTPVLLILHGCQTLTPIDTVDRIDIARFMGRWYVIANIPTFIEKGAHNAVETYRLDPDGTVATTFTFNQDSFDGPLKTYTPRGFIRDPTSNAIWDMQFIWPFKAEYRVVYINDEYSQTIIGRTKRDYLWIMARTPTISAGELERLIAISESVGYDRANIQIVPHR